MKHEANLHYTPEKITATCGKCGWFAVVERFCSPERTEAFQRECLAHVGAKVAPVAGTYSGDCDVVIERAL